MQLLNVYVLQLYLFLYRRSFLNVLAFVSSGLPKTVMNEVMRLCIRAVLAETFI